MKDGIKLTIFVCALFALTAANLGCKKKKSETPVESAVTPTTPAPAVIDINHDAVTEYKVEGASFSYPSTGIEGGMSTSASYASSMSGTSTASYSSDFSGSSATYFSIEKGTIRTPGIGKPGEEAFRSFFVIGNVNYSPNHLNGVVIEHRDPSGTIWSTEKGSADQTGSLFKIEAIKETIANYQDIKVYATFNCKLYDNNGNSKTLTDGKFVGYFENN